MNELTGVTVGFVVGFLAYLVGMYTYYHTDSFVKTMGAMLGFGSVILLAIGIMR